MINKICDKTPHTFNARYGLTRHLYKISDGSYILEGPSRYSRGAEGMVDLEGGPYIEVGMPMSLCCNVDSDPECGIKIHKHETIQSVKFINHDEACALKGMSQSISSPDKYCYIHILTKH